MRRQRSWPNRPDRGECALRKRLGSTWQPGDIRVQGHQKPGLDRPIPRRLGDAEPAGIRAPEQAVMPRRLGGECAQIHAPTGYSGGAEPAELDQLGDPTYELERPGPGNRDQARPEADSGRFLPRIRSAVGFVVVADQVVGLLGGIGERGGDVLTVEDAGDRIGEHHTHLPQWAGHRAGGGECVG